MAEKPKLERQAMCDRLAMEFQDEWIVNLGVGMPTLCSNYVDPSRDIITPRSRWLPVAGSIVRIPSRGPCLPRPPTG
mgnify:CR=1 FL=1